jgi:diadenosine tetraphosphatase ApaH/serine/threonine PP2A family protein phosphatase
MRYAILSDVHANLPALRAVLDDLATQVVAAAIYLGDAVGYYADSAAVIALLRDLVAPQPCLSDGEQTVAPPWVAGNHEWGVSGRLAAYHFSPAALATLTRTRAGLDGELHAFLKGLPQRIELELDEGLAATIVHASPLDPVGATGAGYIDNGEDARDAAHAFSTPICLVGHTHYPRVCYESRARSYGHSSWESVEMFEEALPGGCYQLGAGRVILNPGSVGQPRDGDPRASYAILDTIARTFSVRRIPYDIGATQARVRDWLHDASAALIDGQGGLAERLNRGI